MKAILFVLALISVLVSIRVYDVMHRKLPKGLENKRQLRWLDEFGRIANAMVSYINTNKQTNKHTHTRAVQYIHQRLFHLTW